MYKYNNNKFIDILPKLSPNDKYPPSLNKIFYSRILYIPEANITKEYIRYIRPINENKDIIDQNQNEIIIPPELYQKRNDQLNYKDFFRLCMEEKIIYSQKLEYNKEPFISISIPYYNKANNILKSIRSIQNQSFKNIEIIIVNDCSTDNSSNIFEYLLKTDPRIRIFYHMKNMGAFRSRVDGHLYSRGKYLVSFEPDDLYEDNYVLEDAYNLLQKYNIDSIKFLWRVFFNYNSIDKNVILFHCHKSKVVYGTQNIEKFNYQTFKGYCNVWTRFTKAEIYTKGLYLLENYVLNQYKNVWDDVWQNEIVNKVSNNLAIIERPIYLYLVNEMGEGTMKIRTAEQRDKLIKEKLGFMYFKYNMAPKTDNKHSMVMRLKLYNERRNNVNLSDLKTKFDSLYNLIDLLINDNYVSNDDKIILRKILEETKARERGRGINIKYSYY